MGEFDNVAGIFFADCRGVSLLFAYAWERNSGDCDYSAVNGFFVAL
jgi:hypothetical protein